LADFAVDNDLLVISDEVYERIVFEGRHISIASLPEMFERTITVFSCSKTYAMSGWRVGWTIAPDDIMVELGKVHQNVITCAPSFIQVGALAALLKGEEALNGMVETYRMRRDYVAAALNDIPGIHCKPPEGTFYAFPTFDLDMDSFDFAAFLLKEARVAVTPGGAFGENACRHFRLSFATSMENLREGIARIREAMERVV
ncbi:MAG TPA: aminotransferase class I/II-fold pyridoxal phosphate-dependent enzyme, partial [Thermoplasmata archaeon]|nr:aminotransferase class I/II-fold pyridoxal phosphate-dependent enzyme [Thermoplasmata archaeon]